MSYNYKIAVKDDVSRYLVDNCSYLTIHTICLYDFEYDKYYDELFLADDVTGNGSGSYTFDAYRAQKNLVGNLDLLCEALDEFCADTALYARCLREPETADVIIRCYLLPSIFAEVVEEWRLYFNSL